MSVKSPVSFSGEEEYRSPFPPPDEDALPFAGSGSLLKVRKTRQRAASGATQHRR